MSEEFQGGNQTTTEPISQEPVQQTEPVQTQEPVTMQEPNYFELKYNKEPVKVSYDEAPAYIQKGLNYDKVHQQLEEYQQRMQELTNFYGYQSEDQVWQALQEAREAEKRQAYEEAGINPDLLNQAIENHPSVQYAKQLEQQQQSEARFNQEASELFSEFPDLKPEEIPPEAFQLQQDRGLRLVDAYKITTYSMIGQQKEQEAIQKLQNNALSTPGSLGAGGEPQTKTVSNMSKSEFENLIQRVKRGERVEL